MSQIGRPSSVGSTSVLVTGDVVCEHFLYEGSRRRPGSPVQFGTRRSSELSGAALVKRLLDRAFEASKVSPPLAVLLGFDEQRIAQHAPNRYFLMRPAPLPKGSGGTSDSVWRVHRDLGFDTADTVECHSAAEPRSLDQHHSVVVINDSALGYRRWPNRDAWPRFLTDSSKPLPDWLVIQMSSPVAAGDLWHTIVSGETQDEPPKNVRAPSDLLSRTILVTSINDLRLEPMHVTGSLSWERAALDFCNGLLASPRLSSQHRPRCVVVSLSSDAALIAETLGNGQTTLELVFDAARLEGEFDEELQGTIEGCQSCLAAALAVHLVNAAPGRPFSAAIQQAVHIGLNAMRRMLVAGHGPANYEDCSQAASLSVDAAAKVIAGAERQWVYGTTSVPVGDQRSENWAIAASGSASRALWGLGRRVALFGVSQLGQIPYLQMGKLFAIDRSEIESLRTLKRLIRRYCDNPADKPLSIAAFGPPGAGKSFGIKQIAKGVMGLECSLLEFNLSQFQDARELRGLFHQVRDEALRGKVPVVFWDEFDSRELYWLQFLLAPMQDGTFQEDQVTHPIGKCIFVFAGGTALRFADFGSKLSDEDSSAKKVPDFKSRLAGYLNVLGPDPRNHEDLTFPVRRALLLRVHLGAAPGSQLAIDPGLVEAFLKIDKYRHGARSLEKIAEQLRLSSPSGEYYRSSLPPRSVLDLHVDSDRFLSLVEAAP